LDHTAIPEKVKANKTKRRNKTKTTERKEKNLKNVFR